MTAFVATTFRYPALGEGSRIGEYQMSYQSLALAVAAFSSMHVASADAQSVYVAPGGVYVGSGPVYVIPPPTNGAAPYVAPTNGYEYGPPAVVAPAPAVVDGDYYGAPNGDYYGAPNGGYYGAPNGGYYGASYGGYHGAPLVAYGAERVLRPPVAVPYQSTRFYLRGTRRPDFSPDFKSGFRISRTAVSRRPPAPFRR
jgi:hypothetical protein